jgi:hypothetical protein
MVNQINRIYTFYPSLLVFFPFHQIDLLAAASTFKVVVVHASPPLDTVWPEEEHLIEAQRRP